MARGRYVVYIDEVGGPVKSEHYTDGLDKPHQRLLREATKAHEKRMEKEEASEPNPG